MDKHAPTPFKIQPYVDGIDILDANGAIVAHLADREIADADGAPPGNAKFIARACNSYDALLDALKTIVRMNGYIQELGRPIVWRQAMEVARDAIANAEGRAGEAAGAESTDTSATTEGE